MSMSKKVVVGLSGGVDSSVAAYLLKQQGYDVYGLFMINWKNSDVTITGSCTWEEDVIVARLVARKLDIPLKIVDSSQRYYQRVVEYMFSEYGKGRTPNPDVLCNREIKFDVFEEYARELDADYIATGHYAHIEEINVNGKKIKRLLAAKDRNKDQSYFLCQLSQQQLEKVIFPLGQLTKPQVREIASAVGLASAHRKDSQGICFVGKVDLPVFLQQKLAPKKGKIIELPASARYFKERHNLEGKSIEQVCEPYDFRRVRGWIVGEHNGAHYYTVGQRRGLGVGGKQKPLFVLGIDTQTNIVYVGQGHDHPGLLRRGLFVRRDDIHWVRPDLSLSLGQSMRAQVRIRYRQPLQQATLYQREEDMYIVFDQWQRAITPGQFAVWYVDDELLGSGIINA